MPNRAFANHITCTLSVDLHNTPMRWVLLVLHIQARKLSLSEAK